MESAKQFRKRRAILDCLQQTKQHPSAELLHRLLQEDHPDISLATVYRNLALFKQQGAAVSLGTVNGVEHFDGDTTPHWHFLCSGCGAILDVPQSNIPRAAAQALGCRVDSCQVLFSGLCRSCLQNNEKEN